MDMQRPPPRSEFPPTDAGPMPMPPMGPGADAGVPPPGMAGFCDRLFVDSNRDGLPDALDIDCNGIPDLRFDQGFTCLPRYLDLTRDGFVDAMDTDCDGRPNLQLTGGPFCFGQVIDENRDTIGDGYDFNCDGAIDWRFNGASGPQTPLPGSTPPPSSPTPPK
jgi:hypothetical protein